MPNSTNAANRLKAGTSTAAGAGAATATATTNTDTTRPPHLRGRPAASPEVSAAVKAQIAAYLQEAEDEAAAQTAQNATARASAGPRMLPDGLADYFYTAAGEREWWAFPESMRPGPWDDGKPKPNWELYRRKASGLTASRNDAARGMVAAQGVNSPAAPHWHEIVLCWCARYGSRRAWGRESGITNYNTLCGWFSGRRASMPSHKILNRMVAAAEIAHTAHDTEHRDYIPAEHLRELYVLQGAVRRRKPRDPGAQQGGVKAKPKPKGRRKVNAGGAADPLDGANVQPVSVTRLVQTRSAYAPKVTFGDICIALQAVRKAADVCGSQYALAAAAGISPAALARFTAGTGLPHRTGFAALSGWMTEQDAKRENAGLAGFFQGSIFPVAKLAQYRHNVGLKLELARAVAAVRAQERAREKGGKTQ